VWLAIITARDANAITIAVLILYLIKTISFDGGARLALRLTTPVRNPFTVGLIVRQKNYGFASATSGSVLRVGIGAL
jgi:hypothetical protein